MTDAVGQADAVDPANGTVLVTGGTSGIGRETVHRLAADGATVLVHGRDAERGEEVCETVEAETPGEARFYRADFADFDAVRSLAGRIRSDVDRLDVLVNNAGTWQAERRLVDPGTECEAGIEFTTAINHCAHFLLTAELWPLLAASDARVVTVASSLHRRVDFDLETFVGPEGPSGQDAYNHSKLANVLFGAELARRAADTGVTSNTCHPGIVPSTALTRETGGLATLIWKLFGAVGRVLPVGPVETEEEAAETQYYLASSPEVEGVTGEYFANCEPKTPSEAARSEANQRRLWEWTADVLDVSPSFPSG